MDPVTANGIVPLPVWSISENRFIQLFEYINFLDENFPREQISITFNETIKSDKQHPWGYMSPPNGCVRHQFMNFLIKACIKKYKSGPKTKLTISKAMQNFLDQ